jgi:HSP20 family protein
VVLPAEVGEFADDVRRIFGDLGRAFGADHLTAECSPPLDVYETDESVEITVDLAGVERDAVRVIVRGNAVLVAGEKAARRSRGDASFHLVERGFGRFARMVRFSAACDSGNARALLVAGELRVTLPKIRERRGRAIPIAVANESRPS